MLLLRLIHWRHIPSLIVAARCSCITSSTIQGRIRVFLLQWVHILKGKKWTLNALWFQSVIRMMMRLLTLLLLLAEEGRFRKAGGFRALRFGTFRLLTWDPDKLRFKALPSMPIEFLLLIIIDQVQSVISILLVNCFYYVF